jgi:hypothetical protein
MSMNALKLAATSLAALGLAVAASGCTSDPGSPAVASAGSATTNRSSSLSPPSGGAGTGSGSGRSRGSGGSVTMGGGSASQMRKFASCMRSHGVPTFPDPSADGTVTFSGIDPESSSFTSAQKACRKYTPNGGQAPSPAEQAKAQAQALKFSACMRSHGVPKFPDPQFSGGRASLRIGPSSGIDPSSPVFQAAEKACRGNLPGSIQSRKGAP